MSGPGDPPAPAIAADRVGRLVLLANRAELSYWAIRIGAELAARVPLALRIKRARGTKTPFMKYIVRTDFGPFTIAGNDTSSSAIGPDAARRWPGFQPA